MHIQIPEIETRMIKKCPRVICKVSLTVISKNKKEDGTFPIPVRSQKLMEGDSVQRHSV